MEVENKSVQKRNQPFRRTEEKLNFKRKDIENDSSTRDFVAPRKEVRKIIVPIIIGLFVLSIILATGVFLYQKSQKVPQSFNTENPFYANIIQKTLATGSIVPRKQIALKSHISGVVDKIYVAAGDQVEKGRLIASIRVIPNPLTLNTAENDYTMAAINLAEAEKELTRQTKLYKEQIIAESVYNQHLVTYKKAKEDLQAADNNVQVIKSGSSAKTGKVTNEIRSTSKGMLLDLPIKEGSFVIESNTFNEGTHIASIADMTNMIFVGKVDESEVEKLKKGMDLKLDIASIKNKRFDAKLEYISPIGIVQEGAIQFEVKATVVLSTSDFIRAGYSANADIVLDSRDSVMAINEGVLKYDKERPFVEVETQPDVFEKRYIKLGLSDGIIVEVLDGLTNKDKIKSTPKITADKIE